MRLYPGSIENVCPRTGDRIRRHPTLQLIGDEWITVATSAVLEVPSAVIETDSNYLLNPRHPDFHAIRVMDPQRFEFDLRLLRSCET